MNLFITQIFEDPTFGILYLVIVTFSICLHEYGHARCALWQGDDTAAVAGHLTLNPLKQMGVMSLLMLLFLGLAWGAVPVTPRKFKHKYSDALVSFAGPAMNLFLWFLGIVLMAIAMSMGPENSEETSLSLREVLGQIGFIFSYLNLALFVINMMPCYPLDGWGIITSIAPRKIYGMKRETLNIISVVFILILFFNVKYIFGFSIWVSGLATDAMAVLLGVLS